MYVDAKSVERNEAYEFFQQPASQFTQCNTLRITDQRGCLNLRIAAEDPMIIKRLDRTVFSL